MHGVLLHNIPEIYQNKGNVIYCCHCNCYRLHQKCLIKNFIEKINEELIEKNTRFELLLTLFAYCFSVLCAFFLTFAAWSYCKCQFCTIVYVSNQNARNERQSKCYKWEVGVRINAGSAITENSPDFLPFNEKGTLLRKSWLRLK